MESHRFGKIVVKMRYVILIASILLLILGFSLGQMTQRQYTVYGMPGQSRAIGDTGMILTIDDFIVDLRDDDTVAQYTAHITVRDPSNPQDAHL